MNIILERICNTQDQCFYLVNVFNLKLILELEILPVELSTESKLKCSGKKGCKYYTCRLLNPKF